MAPHSSKGACRSSLSKKDSEDKDKGKDKQSRYQTTGDWNSRRPIPEVDEYAKSSSRKEKSVLNSAFFKDESRVPPSHTPPEHDVKDPKKSKHEIQSKKSSTNYSHRQSSRQGKPQPRHKFKTAFTNPKDIEMAEKQTRIASLKPAERIKQEEWAQEKLQIHGTCPAGFSWWEYNDGVNTNGRKLLGYRCFGGNHLVTHELLAAGDGGCYVRSVPTLIRGMFSASAVPVAPSVSGMPGVPNGYGMPQMFPGVYPAPHVTQAPQAYPQPDPQTQGDVWHGPQYMELGVQESLATRRAAMGPMKPVIQTKPPPWANLPGR
ncbi:hypothetical protein BKA65DRAFT_592203 [Rhexocercosporidium sp. MPI-PUGE-AT-0058]|nr:hypothetical protein BKA65DRAFT_592203 [Rhexocercosporidium sp. MPI-PUGE-AT-0058]